MRSVTRSIVFLLIVAVLASPSPSTSQTYGCSIVPEHWVTVQQALDTIFVFACTKHDLCYRACNPIGGPYFGYWYKDTCDITLYGDLLAACNGWAFNLQYPNSVWETANEFADECATVAGAAYLGVAVFGTNAFLNGQCDHCNQWACQQISRGYDEGLCEILCGWGRDRDDCEQTPWGWDCPPCPIALDLQGNGLKLSGPNPPLYFDLDGDGTLDHTSWTRRQTKDGFLVFDRNGNGLIDDGRELFGTATPPLLATEPVRHGYEALAEFDRISLGGNENGMLDEGDRMFQHLQVWRDRNRDGVTQDGELAALAELGITEISLSYYRDDQEDQWGNVQRWWSPIYFDDGSDSMSVDVFFQRLPE